MHVRTLLFFLTLFAAAPVFASELVDAILGVDPASQYRSGTGTAYERTFRPAEQPQILDDDPLLSSDSLDYYRTPLFDTAPFDDGIDPEPLPASRFDTDVPLLDSTPQSVYELLDSEPTGEYEF